MICRTNKILVILSSLILCSSFTDASANQSRLIGKEYNITLSIDNHSNYSQHVGTDIALSLINSLAYADQKYQWSDKALSRLLTTYASYYITLINHEVTGHAFRTNEFEGTVEGFSFGLSGARTYIYLDNIKSHRIQKNAIISTAGMQSDSLLSQKLANQLLSKKQVLDPVTSAAYIFSAGDQLEYSYLSDPKENGNDIVSYCNDMQNLYGAGSITRNKIRSVAFLNLIDPILFASLYNLITAQEIAPPMLKMESIEIMPAAGAVLTPYGVLEKRLIVYINSDYTSLIKLTLGFGKENKTNQPMRIKSAQSSTEESFITPDSVVPKKHNTGYLELSVDRIASFNEVNIGFTIAGWKQPELFKAIKPRYAKIKNGGMFLLSSNYQLRNDMILFSEFGYKTSGFMINQPVKNTPIIRVGIKWKI